MAEPDETALPVVAFHPYRWGDPAHPADLPPAGRALVDQLGLEPPPAPPAVADLHPPPSGLADGARAALEAIVGPDAVQTGDEERVRRTRGFSTPDLVRMRAGDLGDAPDAVVLPAGHAEVAAVLAWCAAERVAVVPYAGGTSVVGGLAARREGFAAVLSLALDRMDGLLTLDEESRVATFAAGTRATAAEALLRERGLTLGHFPQSYEGASIGGYAATRSSGQSSAGFGRFDELVVGLKVATPAGHIELGAAPKSAAGPDFRQLIMGSEGTLGVITEVALRVRPAPAERVYDAWAFDSFAAGATALRRLAQDGPRPTALRLSDPAETAVFAAGSPAARGTRCQAIAGFEGTPADVAARRAGANEVLRDAGGEALSEEIAEAWRTGRFRGPYSRDPLLDAGIFVETFETVTFWSNLHRLKADVTEAIQGALGGGDRFLLVLCHISHVYETGASLYFTVITVLEGDPLPHWCAAKKAASDAIRAAGASITHHHAVGTDHKPWFTEEVGPLPVAMLRAAKAAVDPAGILNPGILIDP